MCRNPITSTIDCGSSRGQKSFLYIVQNGVVSRVCAKSQINCDGAGECERNSCVQFSSIKNLCYMTSWFQEIRKNIVKQCMRDFA